MADYRDWCSYCGNEINFGSHDPDCELMHAKRIAAREEREFEEHIRAEYRAKTEDELYSEFIELVRQSRRLSESLRANDRKSRFVKEYLWDRMGYSKIREKLKEDGLSWDV